MEINKLLYQLLLVTLVNRGKVMYSLLKNGVCDIWCRMLAFSRDKGDLVIMQTQAHILTTHCVNRKYTNKLKSNLTKIWCRGSHMILTHL